MKVYAEYFEKNGLTFRANTLLRFGDGWDLIGNAVLANPGSSKPMEKINVNDSIKVREFYSKYRLKSEFIKDRWYEFSCDPTMGFIEKIFNGFYVEKNKNLNGVIQLFNTFNIRNKDLQLAIEQADSNKDYPFLFSNGVENYFYNKPTYFGFSNQVLENRILRPVAENIFNNSSIEVRKIYRDNFDENSFYHPMYINRSYKKKGLDIYKNEILLPLFSL